MISVRISEKSGRVRPLGSGEDKCPRVGQLEKGRAGKVEMEARAAEELRGARYAEKCMHF